MKKLFLSVLVVVLGVGTSFAQLEHDPNGGFGGPVKPDLIILDATIPQNASAQLPFTISFTVRNRHNVVAVPAHTAAVEFSWSNGMVQFLPVSVPAFAVGEIDKTITVTFPVIYPNFFATYIGVNWIQADAYYQISEAYELNNYLHP
jgi:hypothetical protein